MSIFTNYFNDKKKRRKTDKMDIGKEKYILRDTSPFHVTEAYKMLRTNIMFSIPDEKCRKIMISSPNQHEGKSITSINLGIVFAQNNAKVLLIDCDLRLPTIAKKLEISSVPGLSNMLIGLSEKEAVIHHLENGLDVIPAGEIPPNPSELLGSAKMKTLIQGLEEDYDYIILDTPPVNVVSDSLNLLSMVSGVALVIRCNVANQESVDTAVNKLKLTGAKIFGFVVTGADSIQKRYYKKNGYGKEYSYGYGYGYDSAVQKKETEKRKT